ncbi:hypothetical protein ACFQ2B_07405 [Streptomyces stramineus]
MSSKRVTSEVRSPPGWTRRAVGSAGPDGRGVRASSATARSATTSSAGTRSATLIRAAVPRSGAPAEVRADRSTTARCGTALTPSARAARAAREQGAHLTARPEPQPPQPLGDGGRAGHQFHRTVPGGPWRLPAARHRLPDGVRTYGGVQTYRT